ncbi:hypothetical protein [Tropicimonas isoalkanivorans]|uniref:Uncharacterized protein n=1 Tax=Tropicimonas isoalkanivorans TaxID=441112 RepID=A0A1I1K5K7_9RHOB|nr:hypothetical protein [Tropicimonas isoalkanivorans]SFC56257.1 hypothetical protein SAMN04488094_10676 [Tropicimonas isoalkanivorans]
MHTVSDGYQSLSLLFRLNWDRLLYTAAILGALTGAAALASALS